jgi:hypothetical protein
MTLEELKLSAPTHTWQERGALYRLSMSGWSIFAARTWWPR